MCWFEEGTKEYCTTEALTELPSLKNARWGKRESLPKAAIWRDKTQRGYDCRRETRSCDIYQDLQFLCL